MSVLKTYEAAIGFKPSATYKLKGNRIEGKIDGLDAVKQAVNIALSVNRFAYLIYSSDYGNELDNFIGKQRNFVKGDIERRISECLMQDDRISGISDFTLSFEGENAFVSFKVNSAFGDFSMERSAQIG